MTRTVRDVMTEEVHTVPPTESLAVVQELMLEGNFRHVPVVDGEELVGLITQRDLATALGPLGRHELTRQQLHLRDIQAARIMVRSVETVEPDEDLRVAADMLLENKFGCLPVCEGRRLLGIITESDFVRLVADGGIA